MVGKLIEMPEEEFIITGIQIEQDHMAVAFTVTNTEERMKRLLDIALRKWIKQAGLNIPMPENYKAQIRAQGIPPMVMRLPIAQWNNRGFQLNDRVIINVPETVDDIFPVKKKENEFGV